MKGILFDGPIGFMKLLNALAITKHIFLFKMMTEIFLTFGTIKASFPKARFYSQREK